MTIKAMSRQERRASEKLKRSGKTPYGGATAAIAAQFQSAVNLHRAGRLPEAEAAYRAILSHEPDHPLCPGGQIGAKAPAKLDIKIEAPKTS